MRCDIKVNLENKPFFCFSPAISPSPSSPSPPSQPIVEVKYVPYYVQNNTPNVQNNPKNELDEFLLKMEGCLQYDINLFQNDTHNVENDESKIINEYKRVKNNIKQNNIRIIYINCYDILEEGQIYELQQPGNEKRQEEIKKYANKVRKTKAYKYAKKMKTQITRSILNEIFTNVQNKFELISNRPTQDEFEDLFAEEYIKFPFLNISQQYEEEEDYNNMITEFIQKMGYEDPSPKESKNDSGDK